LTPKPRITETEAQAALDAFEREGSGILAADALGIHLQSLYRRLTKARRLGLTGTPAEKPRFRIPAAYGNPPEERPAPIYSPEPINQPASSETIRVLAIGDTHDDPYLSKARLRWIGRHAAEMQPDRIVQIGDICDLESLSFHSGNDTESGRYKPRFLADMASLDEALEVLMEPLAQSAQSIPQFDVTLGNHENRIWRFEDSAPETSGMLQAEFGAKLHRYGIRYHRYGRPVAIGGVDFVHSPFNVMGKPYGGKNAAPNVARDAIRDTVFGHSHKGSVSCCPKVGDDNRVTAIDLGCALPSGHVQSYAKHTTTGWWWGAWELLIRSGRIEGWNAIPMTELQRRYA
jgi:hypothetical protein